VTAGSSTSTSAGSAPRSRSTLPTPSTWSPSGGSATSSRPEVAAARDPARARARARRLGLRSRLTAAFALGAALLSALLAIVTYSLGQGQPRVPAGDVGDPPGVLQRQHHPGRPPHGRCEPARPAAGARHRLGSSSFVLVDGAPYSTDVSIGLNEIPEDLARRWPRVASPACATSSRGRRGWPSGPAAGRRRLVLRERVVQRGGERARLAHHRPLPRRCADHRRRREPRRGRRPPGAPTPRRGPPGRRRHRRRAPRHPGHDGRRRRPRRPGHVLNDMARRCRSASSATPGSHRTSATSSGPR
jgi:hypothetical protein